MNRQIFSSSQDIYNELVTNSDDSWIFGLVAFAVIEEQKIEWLDHFTSQNDGLPPTDEEIKNWYKQQSKGVLLRARDTAEARLNDYSQEVVNEVYDETVKDIEEGLFISELKNLKRFWPQFGVNIIASVVGSIVFASLLIFAVYIYKTDASVTDVGNSLINQKPFNVKGE